jgi:hypothetical protein
VESAAPENLTVTPKAAPPATIGTKNKNLHPFEKPRRNGHPEIQTQRLAHPPRWLA